MSNKPRGLGRGLGDLLADNAPEVRASSVIRRDSDGEVSISPTASATTEPRESRANRLSENETARNLVFPAVTPMVGGASARAAATAAVEEIDEAREILEADAAISGKPSHPSRTAEEITTAKPQEIAEERVEGSEDKKPEQTVVYPRSLKAVFRDFK